MHILVAAAQRPCSGSHPWPSQIPLSQSPGTEQGEPSGRVALVEGVGAATLGRAASSDGTGSAAIVGGEASDGLEDGQASRQELARASSHEQRSRGAGEGDTARAYTAE